MAVPFDLAKLEITGDSTPVLQGVRFNNPGSYDYAISHNGTLVYVPLQTDVQRLVWVDRKGNESLVTSGGREFQRPSPLGKKGS